LEYLLLISLSDCKFYPICNKQKNSFEGILMKKQILIGVGVLFSLTGCATQHHFIEKQTVVPAATVKEKPTTIVIANQKPAAPQMPVVAPRPAYANPYANPYAQPAYANPYAQPMMMPPVAPPMYAQPMQRPAYQAPAPRPVAQAKPAPKPAPKPKVIRSYPKSDVNYDINKIYCCDFPVSYRKKKCTNCN
jgi:hypothetical protein